MIKEIILSLGQPRTAIPSYCKAHKYMLNWSYIAAVADIHERSLGHRTCIVILPLA